MTFRDHGEAVTSSLAFLSAEFFPRAASGGFSLLAAQVQFTQMLNLNFSSLHYKNKSSNRPQVVLCSLKNISSYERVFSNEYEGLN
jgi:hypothetical protein